MRILVGVLIVLHGLITASQAGGSFKPTGGTPNPQWIGWWPISLGQSWLLSFLKLEKSPVGTLIGAAWLIAGAVLVAAALGLFGFIVPSTWWRVLAGVGAALSLLLVMIYAHPLYAIGFVANIAILLVLLWIKWPTPMMLGS